MYKTISTDKQGFDIDGMVDHRAPLALILIIWEVFPFPDPRDSICLTSSCPLVTSPKTTCFPSSQGVGTVVMKNWEPLVLGPALAMESRKGLLCLSLKFQSANLAPQMDLPPVPLWLVKSPPCSMNWGITRWKTDPAYPYPFYPVASARKFSAVLGTTSVKSLNQILPASFPAMVISKYTLLITQIIIKRYVVESINSSFPPNIIYHISQLAQCQLQKRKHLNSLRVYCLLIVSMNQHLQKEFFRLSRNRQQIIRDGSFAARKEHIQNELTSREFTDRNSLIQGQLAKLNAYLIHQKIPDFYAYFFMAQLFLCSDQRLEQALYRELQLMRNKRSHYHTIMKTLQTRQSCLRSLSTSLVLHVVTQQCLFEGSEEGVLRKLQEQISHYRQLTALVIEQIREWLQYLRSISPSIYGDEHVGFFYQNEDYLLKILDDTGFISKSFLSTRVMFSHKQDPFILRPFTDNQSSDAYVQVFKFQVNDRQRYIKCLQFVAEERADYLRRKITVREDRIKEIKRVYQSRSLNQKIFMVGRDTQKQPKPQVLQTQIDFVDELVKKPIKQSKPLIKVGSLRQFNLSKEKEMQVKGEMIKKIREMQFSPAPIINTKNLGLEMYNSEQRPGMGPSMSSSLIKLRPFKPIAKLDKEIPDGDFQKLLRRKELEVLDFDNIRRRTLSSIKLHDKLSLRGPFDNKQGAEELQKIMDQLEQTYPQEQQLAMLAKQQAKERGKTLLQNNEETIGNLRKTIIKQMEQDEFNKQRFEEEKQKERERLQQIVKQNLDNMTVLKLQKEKERKLQQKQVLAYEMGKSELFGIEGPSLNKSQRLTELQEDLKRQMQMKWLREVQQELSHREGINKYQKQVQATDEVRERQLQVALRKQQQEERFQQIEKEERARAMQAVWEQEERKKREIEAQLAVIVQKEKERLQQYSGQQKTKLQEQMRQLMKSKLLTTLRRQSSLYQTQQSQQQRLRQQEERHREQTRLKMQQQFKLQRQLERQREKEQKTRKLKLVAQQMDKLEGKVQRVQGEMDSSKVEQMKRSLADIPDFRKTNLNATREHSIKRMREQFEMELFAFNRPQEINVQQDNFLIKDFKTQLDNEENLNNRELPQQEPDHKPKQEQASLRKKPTTQNAEKDEIISQATDKFTRFSQVSKEQAKVQDMNVELKKMKVPMSSEEYRIYLKKKSVIDEKRIVPAVNPKQKDNLVQTRLFDDFQEMRIGEQPDEFEKLDGVQPRQQPDRIEFSQQMPQQITSAIPQILQNNSPNKEINEDSSELFKKTEGSRVNALFKRRFATSDNQDEFLQSSVEQQKIKKSRKMRKQRRKQQTSSKSPQKMQKQDRRQSKQQFHPVLTQKTCFKAVNQQDLEAYLINHFKNLPKVIRKLNLLKKDELLKTLLQCKTGMIIQCSKGETLIGVAFACENQNKQAIRSLNILHLGAYNEADMLNVLIKTRQLLFLKDPCVQITFSMYYDKQNQEQDSFIKKFQQQFDPYGAIFQKKISNDQTERKHVLRRIVGEESSAAVKDKEVATLKVQQNLFAYSVNHSLGVDTNLSKIDRSFGGWTFLSFFLGKFADQAIFTEQLNSDVSESGKSIKYISRMSLKLKGSSTTVEYRTFQSPFEANLALVEQAQSLVKCDPQLQQNDIPIYWSRLNISMQPVLPFVTAKQSFPYSSYMRTASFLRYTCTKASKVINLKSSLYSSVITVLPCKPSNYKLLITSAVEFDSQPQISLDLYLKLFLANLSQHNLSTDEHIWIPQVKSSGVKRIQQGERFGFNNQMRAELQLRYTEYVGNCINFSRTHRDMFVTPPFILAVLDSNVERIMQGSPIFAHRIDIQQMAEVVTGQSLMQQSDL